MFSLPSEITALLPQDFDLNLNREAIQQHLDEIGSSCSILQFLYEEFILNNGGDDIQEIINSDYPNEFDDDDEEDFWYIICDEMWKKLTQEAEPLDKESPLFYQFQIVQSILGSANLAPEQILDPFPQYSKADAQKLFHVICYMWSH